VGKKKKNLKDLTIGELKGLIEGLGEKPYRAPQVYGWLFKKGAKSLGEMTNLSGALRDALGKGYHVASPVLVDKKTSSDGTVKLLFELFDGERVESVLIGEGERLTICISTQSGCALGCAFCMTGAAGAGRNLKLSEMAGQVQGAMEFVKPGMFNRAGRITNAVLMGMGEPLLNYDEVVKFIEVLTDQKALGFAPSKVTLSTAGVVPGIRRLGRDASIGLAVSLNAATDSTRSRIMPINRKYPLRELLKAMRAYPLKRGKRITVEYVLIKDLNDSVADARRLAGLLKGMAVKVNLIPLNPFPGSGYKAPDKARIDAFHKVLMDSNVNVMVRASKGADIQAACGQLKGLA
jgi:23S rRNA (adenine2503-C2)-methyltransferase